MICLGIESTAHTFSVGLVDEIGQILSLASDTFVPEQGGLHPQKVVEHHYACFENILEKSLKDAQISLDQVDLIAFSQGPGLGPCLRVGAAVARSLSLKLKKPLVGVNHCIAHVEIGRVKCQVEDPITLYVSGGNTIISAFESNRYQIFGETLDIPIGNMLDMVARELDIPHPGGPKLEKMAQQGTHYLPLPYVVKGMDLSFSGLFTATKKALLKGDHDNKGLTKEDVIFSLQETAFAMLAEVFERAVAHTEKKHILLTGGVAANSRLQEIIKYIAEEHGAQFHVVPKQVAGDNGAMIAWTGIIRYLAEGSGQQVSATKIHPKWRMDDVEIPWRQPEKQNQFSHLFTSTCTDHNSQVHVEQIPENLQNYNSQILRKGAEAIIFTADWFHQSAVIKYRLPKRYRIPQIDSLLRSKRTIAESKALSDLNEAAMPVPTIFDVIPAEGIIIMKKIEGHRLKDRIDSFNLEQNRAIFHTVGFQVGKMHSLGRIHGDLTTSNIIYTPTSDLYFIDFGLTQSSLAIEERAVDLHLFKSVMQSTHGKWFHSLFPEFLQGYQQGLGSKEANVIIAKIDEIELRGRYIGKEERRPGSNTNNSNDEEQSL